MACRVVLMTQWRRQLILKNRCCSKCPARLAYLKMESHRESSLLCQNGNRHDRIQRPGCFGSLQSISTWTPCRTLLDSTFSSAPTKASMDCSLLQVTGEVSKARHFVILTLTCGWGHLFEKVMRSYGGLQHDNHCELISCVVFSGSLAPTYQSR